MQFSKYYRIKNAFGRCAAKGCSNRIEFYIDASFEKDGKTVASIQRKHICSKCLREFLSGADNG